MQMNGYMTRKKKLTQDILHYLEKNPEAGDTLEGISQWWLYQLQIENALDEVASALMQLEKEGVVETRARQDGVKVYKIKKKSPLENSG